MTPQQHTMVKQLDHAGYTVYVLTFVGLSFYGFRGSPAIHESFIPRKFRPVWQQVCVSKMIVSQKCKNGGDSLGQLDIELRTSTEAIKDSEEMTNQRLRSCIRENENAKIAQICDL